MSIQTAITSLQNRIQDVFQVLEEKGVDIPEQKTTYTLKTTLQEITLDPTSTYTKVVYQNGTTALFDIVGTLDASLIPGLANAVEFYVGSSIVDIAVDTFSGCTSLTSFTIHGKTWQDAIDNSYWGVPDPNIMYGDWDKYISFANAYTSGIQVKMQINANEDYPLPEINLLSSTTGVDGSWSTYDLTSTIRLNSYGDRVFFKAAGRNTAFAVGTTGDDGSTKSYVRFIIIGKTVANGNIMSLLDSENTLNSIETDYCFTNLFQGCTALLKTPKLYAQLIGDSCCRSMFSGCSSLKDVSDISIINEASGTNCAATMFYNCSSLETSPKLAATILGRRCYYSMFFGCSSLKELKLPATELSYYSYYGLARNCSNLSSIQVSFKTWTPTGATSVWLANAGIDVPETTFICPNQLDVSTKSNDRVPEDTSTHTWNIVKILE